MAERLPTRRASGQPLSAAVVSAVFALTILAFLPALDGAFLAWDDDVNFTANPHYRGFTAEHLGWMFGGFHVGHYMPLTWLSAALDHALWGMDPWGYHLTNVLLHATGALFACLALRQLFALIGLGDARVRVLAAAAGALCFSLHPLRVESVAWITERRDVLSGALLLASVWAWLAMQAPGARARTWYATSIVLFGLSLLAKVSGMTLPVALLLVDAWLLGRRAWAEKLPYLALAAAGAVLGFLGQRESTEVLAGLDDLSVLDRLVQAGFALGFYLWKTVLPLDLSPFYEQRGDLSPAWLGAVIVGSLALAVAARRGRPWARASWCAWASYVVLALPLIGLVHAGRQVAADRYTYVACLPFAALFGAAVCTGLGRSATRAVCGLATLAVLVALPLAARAQIAHWSDTEALFRRVVEIEPDNFLGHRKLGIELHEQGRHDEAIAEYRKCLELRPDRDHAEAWTSLAITYFDRGAPGDLDLTLRALEAALADDPLQRLAWRMYEDLNLRAGRVEPLIARLEGTLAAHPDHAPGFVSLARLLSRVGRNQEAIAACQRALELAPEDPDAHNLWGLAEANLGRFEAAERHFVRALELRPDEPAYRTNLDYVRAHLR